jgi:uncharacterized membrane protein YfcA
MRFFRFIPNITSTKWLLLVFGLINGFVGGIAGNASLIRMPALLSMGMTKELFVGTSVMIAFLMNLSKIGAYVPNTEWTPTMMILTALSIPTLLISVWLGKKLLKYVSIQLFENIQLAIILFGGIRLLFFS